MGKLHYAPVVFLTRIGWLATFLRELHGFPVEAVGLELPVHDRGRREALPGTYIFSDLKLIGELYEPTLGLINVGVPREHRGAAHGVLVYLH